MIVVGVDPGELCGVAIIEGRHLLKAHTVKGSDAKVVLGLVQQVAKVGAEQGGVVVVVELQFAARGRRSNPKGLATLMKRRHVWEVLCEIYGVRVADVWPASWQSQLKIAPRLGADGSKRTTKQRSLEAARFYFGDDSIQDAEQADAALIARWYLDRPEAKAAAEAMAQGTLKL